MGRMLISGLVGVMMAGTEISTAVVMGRMLIWGVCGCGAVVKEMGGRGVTEVLIGLTMEVDTSE
jgi:hypothetical protein